MLSGRSSKRQSSSKKSLLLGQRVRCGTILAGPLEGTIRYIGKIEGKGSREFIGIELDRAIGKNDGSVNSVRYFKALKYHGIFVRPDKVKPISPAESKRKASSSNNPRYNTIKSPTPSLRQTSPQTTFSQSSNLSKSSSKQLRSRPTTMGGIGTRSLPPIKFPHHSNISSPSYSPHTTPIRAAAAAGRSTGRKVLTATVRKGLQSTKRPVFPKGLRNLGNTCFFNSVVQILAHSRSFRFEILRSCSEAGEMVGDPSDKAKEGKYSNSLRTHSSLHHPSPKIGDVEVALKNVINSLFLRAPCSLSSPYVDPTKLFNLIVERVPAFGKRRQQDALELYKHLLDFIETDSSNSYNGTITGAGKVSDANDDEKGHNQQQQQQQPSLASIGNDHSANGSCVPNQYQKSNIGTLQSPLISRVFDGVLASIVKCESCQGVTETLQRFSELSVPLPPERPERKRVFSSVTLSSQTSLQECMKLFSEAETITQYRCAVCTRKSSNPSLRTKATKQILIKRQPKVLVLHVKRYVQQQVSRISNSRVAGFLRKLQMRVQLPSVLDISPYVLTEELPSGEAKAMGGGGDAEKNLKKAHHRPPPSFFEVRKSELRSGKRVDCRDQYGKWLAAEIKERDSDDRDEWVIVHFLGWESQWNEKVSLCHGLWRFARYKSYTSEEELSASRPPMISSLKKGSQVIVHDTQTLPRSWVKGSVLEVEGNQVKVDYEHPPGARYEYWFHALSGEINTLHENTQNSSRSDPSAASRRYRLCGVVGHRGSLRGGHYTAYVRASASSSTQPKGDALKGVKSDENSDSWYSISDSRVKKIMFEDVMACQAYLVLYELCQ